MVSNVYQPGKLDPFTKQDLANSLNLTDAMSQEAFEQIASIADLARFALKAPGAQNNLERVANALLAITALCENTMECISSEAEKFGVGYGRDEVLETLETKAVAPGKVREIAAVSGARNGGSR